MRILRQPRSRLWKLLMLLLFNTVGVVGLQNHGHTENPEFSDSVAMVANLAGEVSISSEAASFQKTIVYGDYLKTEENSVLSMLVEDGALISMKELSEISIEKNQNSGRLIRLVSGRTCISTKSDWGEGNGILPLQTDNVIVYAKPGTMFSVEVSNTAPQKSIWDQSTRQPILARFNGRQPEGSLTDIQVREKYQTDTIHVLQGSVKVVSHIAGVKPVIVPEGYVVNARRGKISQPVRGEMVQCQIQDLQKNPQHTKNPEEIKKLIVQEQSKQTSDLIAALFTPASPPSQDSEKFSTEKIILPITDTDQTDISPQLGRIPITITPPVLPSETIPSDSTITFSVPNEDLIQIEGSTVEVNASTLTLNNSEIPAANNAPALVSVSAGGEFLGTSTDPIVSFQNSQTTTQSAVTLLDDSLLEASAPLIAASSTNSSDPFASQITTNGSAVRVASSQVIAGLPADAVALIQLDASRLVTAGSLFELDSGVLTVNGNLASLTNGSTLITDSLVTLSTGSSFGLTGGSLLFGDASSIANINNSLCAGGGCIDGFVFAPPGNTISIAQNFQPTQGVSIAPDAALIVVNGTGNTVVLSP